MKKELDSKKIPISPFEYYYNDNSYRPCEIIEKERDNYAKPIGEFLISFSGLEREVDKRIAEFINNNLSDGYRLIKYLTLKQKVEFLFNTWSNHCSFFYNKNNKENYSKKILNIKHEILKINKFRNNVVHADWFSLDVDGFVIVNTENISDIDQNLNFEAKKITPEILFNFIEKSKSIVLDLYNIEEEIEFAVHKEEDDDQSKSV